MNLIKKIIDYFCWREIERKLESDRREWLMKQKSEPSKVFVYRLFNGRVLRYFENR